MAAQIGKHTEKETVVILFQKSGDLGILWKVLFQPFSKSFAAIKAER
jgi:hypothetical protein